MRYRSRRTFTACGCACHDGPWLPTYYVVILPMVVGFIGIFAPSGWPALVAEWKARFGSVDVASALLGLDALIRRDSLLGRLPEIAVPSLVVVGAEDRSLPVPFSRRIHERLPESRFEIIPAAGHLSALEQPARVNAVIRPFLVGLG